MGHEEAVTSLTWRPSQQKHRRRRQRSGMDKPCLLSSSMDRTILLWMEEEYSEVGDGVGRGGGGGDGIWTPISRVGSAGGILGGSLGASLIGFVDAAFSPDASRIVGHGYGGSVHFWTQAVQSNKLASAKDPVGENEIEEDDGDSALVSISLVAVP